MGLYATKMELDGVEYIAVSDYIKSKTTIWDGCKYAKAGKFPAIKYFGKWFALKEDMDEFIKSKTIPNSVVKKEDK